MKVKKRSRVQYVPVYDYVYDVPLISSLQQLLSDSFILDEVHVAIYEN